MNYLPREIVSEILLYFRNYKDELHRSFKLGPRDIDMNFLIMNNYVHNWSKHMNKQTQNSVIENIVAFYNNLFEIYSFTEAEHIVILNKMHKINLYLKNKYMEKNDIYDSYYRT